MEKTDLRVIKTKKALFKSLIELLKNNSFEEIKVSDICLLASVNRSTFYSHFKDKYELFSAYIDKLKEELIHDLEQNQKISTSKEYYLEMTNLFLNHASLNKESYQEILRQNRDSIIMDMVYDAFNHDIEKKLQDIDLKNNPRKVPSKFIADFYLGAVMNIAMKWLINENKYTREEILDYLDNLIPDDLNISLK